jgi:hypothetical protein
VLHSDFGYSTVKRGPRSRAMKLRKRGAQTISEMKHLHLDRDWVRPALAFMLKFIFDKDKLAASLTVDDKRQRCSPSKGELVPVVFESNGRAFEEAAMFVLAEGAIALSVTLRWAHLCSTATLGDATAIGTDASSQDQDTVEQRCSPSKGELVPVVFESNGRASEEAAMFVHASLAQALGRLLQALRREAGWLCQGPGAQHQSGNLPESW